MSTTFGFLSSEFSRPCVQFTTVIPNLVTKNTPTVQSNEFKCPFIDSYIPKVIIWIWFKVDII